MGVRRLSARAERPRIVGRIKLSLYDAETGALKSESAEHNVVCNAGFAALAALLNGETTFSSVPLPSGGNWLGEIQGAVGTGSVTPSVNDTALTTELARIAIAANSRAGSEVVWTFFFPPNQANGTITEGGIFLLASSAAGSGFLLNHAALGAQTKTSAETANLQVTFNLTQLDPQVIVEQGTTVNVLNLALTTTDQQVQFSTTVNVVKIRSRSGVALQVRLASAATNYLTIPAGEWLTLDVQNRNPVWLRTESGTDTAEVIGLS